MPTAEWSNFAVSNEHNSSGSNIPVELWKDILEEACLIPGKNEYGTDPRGYWDMPYPHSILSSRITPDELQYALDTRHSISLVCKSWASVGLPILYSHFRPRLTRDDASIDEYHRIIANNALFRACVRRVSIGVGLSYRKKRLAGQMVLNLIKMLALLERPAIISGPQTMFWKLDPRTRENIVVADFHLGAVPTSVDSLPTEWWKSLRFLSILLDGTAANTSQSMLLSALECLEVRVARRHSHSFWHFLPLPQNMCSGWHAPVLHTLSLDDDDWTRWEAFLERHAETLEILNIQCYPESMTQLPEVTMPRLRELWMEPGPREYYPHTKIRAGESGLEKVVCHRWRDGRYLMDPTHREVSLDEQAAFLSGLLGSWHEHSDAGEYLISGSQDIITAIPEWEDMMKHVDILRKRGATVVFCGDDDRDGFKRVFEPIIKGS